MSNIYYNNSILEKLNDFMNKWFAENGFEITFEIGSDFGYYPTSKIIDWSLAVVDDGMEGLDRIAKAIIPNIDYLDNFILSIFHEIGHHETIKSLSMTDYSKSQRAKKRISQNKTRKGKYYSLPDEYKATEWAVNYIYNNYDKVQVLWNECLNLIKQFYQEISLT